jgi:hypothetical protein
MTSLWGRIRYVLLLNLFLQPALEGLAQAGPQEAKVGHTKIFANALKLACTEVPPQGEKIVIQNDPPWIDKAGKTSIRYTTNKALKTEGLGRQVGYYIRDRDLGQTFMTGKNGFELAAITVRTTDSIFSGAANTRISIQLLEVRGEPKFNDNGTRSGQVVNWSKEAWTDDYIEGETYRSLAVLQGAQLPLLLPPRSYLRFELDTGIKLRLKARRRYAFLLMFESAGENRALALYCSNGKNQDSYPVGHAIRREAKGTTPPKPNDLEDARFPGFSSRIAIQPTTNGYPDVDTYRDFTFFIEKK